MKITRQHLRRIITAEALSMLSESNASIREQEEEKTVEVKPKQDIQTGKYKFHGEEQAVVKVVDPATGLERKELSQRFSGTTADRDAKDYLKDLTDDEPASLVSDDDENPLGVDDTSAIAEMVLRALAARE